MSGFGPVGSFAVASTPVLDSGVLGIIDFVTASPDIPALTLTSVHTLAIASVNVSALGIAPLTLTQVHPFGIATVSVAALSIPPLTLTSVHALGIAAVSTASPSIPTLTLTASHLLPLIDFSTSSPSIPALALGIVHNLLIDHFSTGPIDLTISFIEIPLEFDYEPSDVAHADYEYDQTIDAEHENIYAQADLQLEEVA